MIIIGITGPTGSGKTTALKCIEDRGGRVLDLDAIYHGLLKSSDAMKAELSSRFPGVIQDGVLDRKALGAIVFSDPAALQDLNEITGKYILSETDRILSEAEKENIPLAAIDAINLLEGELPSRCRFTIAVTAPTETRVKRLMERDHITKEYALLRISAQKDAEYFESRCDYTLRNDCATREEFESRCSDLLDRLLQENK